MLVPKVSHDSWERVRGFSQIALGTDKVDVNQLSFSDRLVQLMSCPGGGESFRVAADEVRNSLNNYSSAQWPEGKEILIHPNSQDRSHRPEVSEELAERLTERLYEEYPGMAVDGFGFDKKLQLLLERVAEYYELLGCRVVEAPENISEGRASK